MSLGTSPNFGSELCGGPTSPIWFLGLISVQQEPCPSVQDSRVASSCSYLPPGHP